MFYVVYYKPIKRISKSELLILFAVLNGDYLVNVMCSFSKHDSSVKEMKFITSPNTPARCFAPNIEIYVSINVISEL